MAHQTKLRKNFNTGDYKIGASIVKQGLWYFTDIFFFKSKIIPFSTVLVGLLRLFGAKIGAEVRIKPGIYIKYPWNLEIGDYSWLADCQIENLASVRIGKHCCISQKAMLITGNHNYKKTTFDLITKPIVLEDGVWIGAKAMVGPGVTAHTHSVLSMGSIAHRNLENYQVYQGNPAISIRKRVIE